MESNLGTTEAPAPLTARFQWSAWLLPGLLGLATLALYWPVLGYDFINFDDDLNVTENLHVQQGLSWAGLKWAFLTPVATNWNPLTILSHMLVCQAFGLQPWAHHLVNVLLHAANAALVFIWLRQLTGAQWRSLVIAALFAFHPLRIESVAWVTERKDVLSGFFGLLTLICYTRYARSSLRPLESSPQNLESGAPLPPPPPPPRLCGIFPFSAFRFVYTFAHRQVAGQVSGFKFQVSGHRAMSFPLWGPSSLYYLLSLLCFALGLMSKAMLVTLPFVLLLLDFWPLNRFQMRHPAGCRSGLPAGRLPVRFSLSAFSSLLFEKLPFFALSAGASLLTLWAAHQSNALASYATIPFGARLETALVSYRRYLEMTFWPMDLAVFYPHPGRWPTSTVPLSGIVLLGISWFFFRQRRTRPYLLTGWLWFCGMLVPVIGLSQAGSQALADRFTYFPSLGLLILLVWGVADLTHTWSLRSSSSSSDFDRPSGFRSPVSGLGSQGNALSALFTRLPTGRLPVCPPADCRSSFRFDRSSSYLLSVLSLAAIVACIVLTRQNLGYWRDSETVFRRALAVTTNNYLAHNNLGEALAAKGRVDEAIVQFQSAVRVYPDYTDANNNLGIALAAEGRIDEAILHFQAAIRSKPGFVDAHYNLGVALDKEGRLDEAMVQYQEMIRLQPDNAAAWNNLGIDLAKQDRLDEAIACFKEAVRLKPDYSEARGNLIRALEIKAASPGR